MTAILYEKKDHIALVTINRPEAYNSMDPATEREMASVWLNFRDDDDLWAAVLTGAGSLPFKGIIHVAGISMLWLASERSIRGSVRSAMQIIEAEDFVSAAFPVIGAGSGSFKPEKALDIMLAEFATIDSDADVRVVRYTNKT